MIKTNPASSQVHATSKTKGWCLADCICKPFVPRRSHPPAHATREYHNWPLRRTAHRVYAN